MKPLLIIASLLLASVQAGPLSPTALHKRAEKQSQTEYDQETTHFEKFGLCRDFSKGDWNGRSLETCKKYCAKPPSERAPSCGRACRRTISRRWAAIEEGTFNHATSSSIERRGDLGAPGVTCLGDTSGHQRSTEAPDGSLFTMGKCECSAPKLALIIAERVLEALPLLDNIICKVTTEALGVVADLGSVVFPGGAAVKGVATIVKGAKTLVQNGETALGFASWFGDMCNPDNDPEIAAILSQGDKYFHPLVTASSKIAEGAGCVVDENKCKDLPREDPPPADPTPADDNDPDHPQPTGFSSKSPSNSTSSNDALPSPSPTPTKSSSSYSSNHFDQEPPTPAISYQYQQPLRRRLRRRADPPPASPSILVSGGSASLAAAPATPDEPSPPADTKPPASDPPAKPDEKSPPSTASEKSAPAAPAGPPPSSAPASAPPDSPKDAPPSAAPGSSGQGGSTIAGPSFSLDEFLKTHPPNAPTSSGNPGSDSRSPPDSPPSGPPPNQSPPAQFATSNDEGLDRGAPPSAPPHSPPPGHQGNIGGGGGGAPPSPGGTSIYNDQRGAGGPPGAPPGAPPGSGSGGGGGGGGAAPAPSPSYPPAGAAPGAQQQRPPLTIGGPHGIQFPPDFDYNCDGQCIINIQIMDTDGKNKKKA